MRKYGATSDLPFIGDLLFQQLERAHELDDARHVSLLSRRFRGVLSRAARDGSGGCDEDDDDDSHGGDGR